MQKSFSLGAEQSLRWDKALAVAIEEEEITRKLFRMPRLEAGNCRDSVDGAVGFPTADHASRDLSSAIEVATAFDVLEG